jgi:teichuronic acid exporter
VTDHLRAKTLRGVSWSFLERGGQLGIQFVISIILARLLLPAQFGLIAMLSIFMAAAWALVKNAHAGMRCHV